MLIIDEAAKTVDGKLLTLRPLVNNMVLRPSLTGQGGTQIVREAAEYEPHKVRCSAWKAEQSVLKGWSVWA